LSGSVQEKCILEPHFAQTGSISRALGSLFGMLGLHGWSTGLSCCMLRVRNYYGNQPEFALHRSDTRTGNHRAPSLPGTDLAVAIRPHPRPDRCRKFRCFSNGLLRKRGNEKTEFDVHGARVATSPCSDSNFLSRASYFLELLGRAQGPTLRPSARLRSRAETYGGTPGLTASLPDG
jgi:hypothetical protein